MKNYYYIFFVTALFLSAFNGESTLFGICNRGSGNVVKEKRDVGYYDKIVLKGGSNLFVKQDNYSSLTIEIDDNLQAQVLTELRDRTLYISCKGNICPTRMNVYARMTNVAGFYIKGSCDIIAKQKLSADKLELIIDGTGDVRWKDLSAKAVYIKINGSGDVNIESGDSGELTCVINGSGDMRLDNLKASRVYAKIAGTGDLKVFPINDLRAEIYGCGNVYYRGNPQSVKSSVKGAGEVRPIR